MSRLPMDLGAETADGRVGEALGRDHPVPMVVLGYAAAAGHVALAGEDEDE